MAAPPRASAPGPARSACGTGLGIAAGSPRQLTLSGWEGTDPGEAARWLETADLLLQGTRFDPYTRLLRSQGWLVSPDSVFEDPQASPLLFPCDEDSLSKTLCSLDRDSNAAYIRDCAATEAVLASSECGRPFISQASRLDPAASEVVESWSRAIDQEAIMVLWPGREVSTGSWGAELSLRDWYQQDAGTRNVERRAALAGAPGWEDLRRWNREPPPEHSPWALERRGGVLLVRNRLAFLDRPRRFPLAAFLRLERAIPRSEGPVLVPSLPFSALSKYLRDAVPEKNGEWTGLHGQQYRGLFVRSIARLQPLLHLVESFDPGGKAQLRRRLAAGERLRIPLGRFPLMARLRLVPALRTLGPTYPVVWHPRAAERLASCELELWADLPDEGWAGADLYAALSDFSYGGQRDPATQRNGDALVFWSQDRSQDSPGLSGVTFREGR